MSSFHQSLSDDVAMWQRLGITRVGVSVAKLERHGYQPGVSLVRTADLEVANLIGLGPFVLEDAGQWSDQQARVMRGIDAARTLRSDTMILTTGRSGSLTWEQAAEAFEAAIAPVTQGADSLGIRLALEHTNSLRPDVSFVHTLSDALELAGRLGIGVCCELNACWGERGLESTIRDGVDLIEVVQVSDFAVGTTCTPDRLVPGDGDIPLRRLLAWIVEAGYEGDFDLEIIGPRIEAEGYDSAIGRSIAYVSEMLDDLGA